MKKGFCILLSSALLLTGTVPTWAKEERLLQEPHVYRGIVGTTNFYRDDVLQSSDAEIYLKDGYAMLPVRTFFTSIYPDAQIYWNSVDQQAGVLLGESSIFLYVKENKIVVNREEQPVVGKMEVKNGRLFIPLRNWLTILNQCGYKDFQIKLTVNDKELEQYHCNSNNIIPVGRLNREDVYKEYLHSTLIFPSYIETFGYPMAEARLMGTIVLASDCPFSHEVLEGYENAYFFDPFSPAELAELMKQVMNNTIKKKKIALKENNKKNGWERVYEEVVSQV